MLKILHKNLLGRLMAVAVIGTMACSCSSEEDLLEMDRKNTTSVYATISNATIGKTRASTDNMDGWSTVTFNNATDTIGLFSAYGNMDGAGGNGSFINAPMMFIRSMSPTYQFDNPNLSIDRSKFQYNKTVIYYPYSEGAEGKGLKLRRKKNNEGVDRCVDLLLMGNLNSSKLENEQQLSGNFDHIFSELIIVRGEGFENAENKDITVVINKGCTRLRFVDNTSTTINRNMWKVPELIYDETDGLSYEESRKWMAWQGSSFEPYLGSGLKDAWYVMLPNIPGSGNNTSVDYIELYDNDGNLQRVSSFQLEGGSKQMQPQWRYPIEIKMEGLVPTVYPYQILKWGEEEDITDERTIGIKSAAEFMDWQNVYNTYVISPTDELDSRLFNYGDKHIDETDGSVTWHFYILNDIDFKGADIRIVRLSDVIEGLGNQIYNINLTQSLFGEISGNGRLSGLNISGLTVNNTSKGRNDGIGAVADILGVGGTIEKCEVDAMLTANCKVGVLAGKVEGGVVDRCTFSGLLIGNGSATGTYRYLLATDPSVSNFTVTETKFSGIIYTKKD